MKKLLIFLLTALPLLSIGQTIYTEADYTPTQLECMDTFLILPDGQRSFTGLVIRQGRFTYFLDYPYTVRVWYNNSLIFDDWDAPADRITVKLSQTSYATMEDFKAAAVACDSLIGGGGGGVDTDNQTLSISGDTLYIIDGNSVYLGGYLDNTDSQILSILDDTLSISGGNSVVLPSGSGGVGFVKYKNGVNNY